MPISLRYQRWYASRVASRKASHRGPGCSSRMPYSVMLCHVCRTASCCAYDRCRPLRRWVTQAASGTYGMCLDLWSCVKDSLTDSSCQVNLDTGSGPSGRLGLPWLSRRRPQIFGDCRERIAASRVQRTKRLDDVRPLSAALRPLRQSLAVAASSCWWRLRKPAQALSAAAHTLIAPADPKYSPSGITPSQPTS